MSTHQRNVIKKKDEIQAILQKEERHRLSCDISMLTKERLDRLVHSMDALTLTEVIRRTSELVEVLYRAKREGNKIVLVDPNGNKSCILF